MKKIIILTILIGCSGRSFSKDNVKIHGNISHQLADSIKISWSPPAARYQPIAYKAKLNKGDFAIAFNVPEGYTDLTIINGNEGTEILVQPGADLTLTINAANFDSTVHYEGHGKEIANYMAKCIVEKHSIGDVDLKAQKLSSKEIPEYRTGLKQLLESETGYLQTNGKDLPPDFIEYIKTAQQYEVWYTMHMYPWHRSKGGKETPKESYAVIDDIPEAFDDKYINMLSYRAFLNNFFGMRISAGNARNNTTLPDNSWSDSVYAMSYRGMPPLSAEYIVGSRIYNSMQHTTLEQIEQQYALYKAHFPHSKNLPDLVEAISQKKMIGPGKPEVDFDITTPEGKHMKLSDLKGKVVYIDFWSRSCVPCIAEMSKAKKVREHFKDRPVAFVYVSEDENDGIWKKAINDFEIDAINTHLEKGKLSELVKTYKAEAIPCHYLIDKNGKFADVKAVEPAGEPEKLITQIEKLLE